MVIIIEQVHQHQINKIYNNIIFNHKIIVNHQIYLFIKYKKVDQI